jgi:hypothetical protein
MSFIKMKIEVILKILVCGAAMTMLSGADSVRVQATEP